ncbi:MAG: AAA family ATPase [Pseudomonadota bacterium]
MNKEIVTILQAINKAILGKPTQVKLALSCILARGHLLIEDLPGMGKTSLSKVMSKVLGLQFQRVQFTSDLLPADIIGASIFNKEQGSFVFQQGPVFTEMLLADEVNRATPKTQSALLEAMEEYQVTVDGDTRQLPTPFFVIATQNPTHQIGTYALPESQLDRFLMRISLGYPNVDVEKNLLAGHSGHGLVEATPTVIDKQQLLHLQKLASSVKVSDIIIEYILELITYTRESGAVDHGLSPRGGLAVVNSAKSWAMIEGRSFVVPEDVQAVFEAVANHRLQAVEKVGSEHKTFASHALEDVAVPV